MHQVIVLSGFEHFVVNQFHLLFSPVNTYSLNFQGCINFAEFILGYILPSGKGLGGFKDADTKGLEGQRK